MEPTQGQAKYLKELTPYIMDIMKEEGLPVNQDSINKCILPALDRHRELLEEMVAGKSDRAKKVKTVLTSTVFTDIHRSELKRSLL